MTIAAAAAVGLPSMDGVAWRALASGLWVARRDGRHLGTVQKGRRWLATGADGEPIGTFRSFREAQAAVADPEMRHSSEPRWSAVPPAVAVVALGAAALGAAALASATGWVWTAFLQ